jgi:hypothetical protein
MASNTDHHKPEEEKFDELLNNEAFRDVFDNGFVEGLERRKAKLDGRAQKVQIAQLTVLLDKFPVANKEFGAHWRCPPQLCATSFSDLAPRRNPLGYGGAHC